MSKSIVVESDDPVNPKLKLLVSGNVLVDFDFAKTNLSFNGMKLGESRIQTIDIIAKNAESVKFGEPESNLDGLKTKVISSKDKEGKLSYALELDFTPRKAGRLRGTVTLPIKGQEKDLSLRISSKVEGLISVKPERLNMWKDMPDTVASEINIQSDKESFKILKAVDTSGRMDAKVTTVKKNRHYTVKISPNAKGNRETRSFTSKIMITTSSKDQPEIEVNVFYSPKPRKSSFQLKDTVTPNRKAAKKVSPQVIKK